MIFDPTISNIYVSLIEDIERLKTQQLSGLIKFSSNCFLDDVEFPRIFCFRRRVPSLIGMMISQ